MNIINLNDNALGRPLHTLLNPGCIGLIYEEGKKIWIFNSKRMLSLIDRITDTLESNTFRNRTIQELFNQVGSDKLRIIVLESIDLDVLPGINEIKNTENRDIILDLVYRNRTAILTSTLKNMGYTVMTENNMLRLKIEHGLILSKNYLPQVRISNAKNKCYYVQRKFSSVKECQDYVNSCSLEQIIMDTQGSTRPFRTDYKQREPSRGVIEGMPEGRSESNEHVIME